MGIPGTENEFQFPIGTKSMIYVKPLGLKKKSAACFVFATTNNLILIPRQLLELPDLCMSMGSRALNRQITSKKNYCDKNQFTHQSDSESLRSFNEKKIKRPVTVALPYPSPLHQNEGKQQKKSKSKAFFIFFQQH